MRNLLFAIIVLFFHLTPSAQEVVRLRTADLIPQGYTIEGNAFLEEFSDGSIKIRLSDDFTTPSGPDVRILLSDTLSLAGSEEIVNLSDISHFNGARTFDVPTSISLEDFNFILFYCVSFQQFWASGRFGSVNTPNGSSCQESSISLSNGSGEIQICSSDGIDNVIKFNNSLGLEAGMNYAYLITDNDELLEEVVMDSSYNFEGSSSETQRVYGIHFEGTLIPDIGANRTATIASECHIHSDASSFILIEKSGCDTSFVCDQSFTSTTNLESQIIICPDDGLDDLITLNNNLMISAGAHYAYLLTDSNNVLQEVVLENAYNFEGSSKSVQRVYGIHFDGTLIPAIGSHRLSTSATECFTHSEIDRFLSILKSGCDTLFQCKENFTATTDSVSLVNLCVDDSIAGLVNLRNNLFVLPGEHYAYLLTDTNEILQEIILDSIYDFEGSSVETQRVYGIHFDGQLIPVIGSNRLETTASGCFTHSGDTLFLTITKNGCDTVFECSENFTATTNWEDTVELCSIDGIADLVAFKNSLFIAPGFHYAFLITDTNEVLQEIVLDSVYNFEGSSEETQRVYGIHYDGQLNPVIGSNRLETTASGCFMHSGDTLFLTISKSGCDTLLECSENFTATTNWVDTVDLCPSDGRADIVALKNSLFIAPGLHYAFLITDTNEVLQEIVLDSTYNFEGSLEETQRVYGIHFDGQLDPAIGSNRLETTASRCFIHSGGSLFLTITKSACVEEFQCLESVTATTDWLDSMEVCPGDQKDDIVELRNNLEVPAGEHYVYLITDTNEILQELVFSAEYNFENSNTENQHVYGAHFDGILFPALGFDRNITIASGCIKHSGENQFLTIVKSSLCPNATSTQNPDLATVLKVFPNPSKDLFHLQSKLSLNIQDARIFTVEGKLIKSIKNLNEFSIEQEGIYILRIITDQGSITKKVIKN